MVVRSINASIEVKENLKNSVIYSGHFAYCTEMACSKVQNVFPLYDWIIKLLLNILYVYIFIIYIYRYIHTVYLYIFIYLYIYYVLLRKNVYT